MYNVYRKIVTRFCRSDAAPGWALAVMGRIPESNMLGGKGEAMIA